MNNQEEMKSFSALCSKPEPKNTTVIIPRRQIITNQMNIKMIYPNDDARELIEVFNPDLMKKDSSPSNTPVRMPAFPPITSQQLKAAKNNIRKAGNPIR